MAWTVGRDSAEPKPHVCQDRRSLLLLLWATEPPQTTWLRFRGSRPLGAIKWAAGNFDPAGREGLESTTTFFQQPRMSGAPLSWGRRGGVVRLPVVYLHSTEYVRMLRHGCYQYNLKSTLSLLANTGDWVVYVSSHTHSPRLDANVQQCMAGSRRKSINIQRARRLGASIFDAAATTNIPDLWWHPPNVVDFRADLGKLLRCSCLTRLSVIFERNGFRKAVLFIKRTYS